MSIYWLELINICRVTDLQQLKGPLSVTCHHDSFAELKLKAYFRGRERNSIEGIKRLTDFYQRETYIEAWERSQEQKIRAWRRRSQALGLDCKKMEELTIFLFAIFIACLLFYLVFSGVQSYQSVKELQGAKRVLIITSHPDDEVLALNND